MKLSNDYSPFGKYSKQMFILSQIFCFSIFIPMAVLMILTDSIYYLIIGSVAGFGVAVKILKIMSKKQDKELGFTKEMKSSE